MAKLINALIVAGLLTLLAMFSSACFERFQQRDTSTAASDDHGHDHGPGSDHPPHDEGDDHGHDHDPGSDHPPHDEGDDHGHDHGPGSDHPPHDEGDDHGHDPGDDGGTEGNVVPDDSADSGDHGHEHGDEDDHGHEHGDGQ